MSLRIHTTQGLLVLPTTNWMALDERLDLSKPQLPSIKMKVCFKELVRIQSHTGFESSDPSQRDWYHCHSHHLDIHSSPSAVLRKNLAIRAACLPASLPFSLRNKQSGRREVTD